MREGNEGCAGVQKRGSRLALGDAAKAALFVMFRKDPSLSAGAAQSALKIQGLADVPKSTVYAFMRGNGLGARRRSALSDAAKAALFGMFREEPSLSARAAKSVLNIRRLADVSEMTVYNFMRENGLGARNRRLSDAAKAALFGMLHEDPSLSARAVKNALEIRGLADASVQTVYKFMRGNGLGARKRRLSEAAKSAVAAMLHEDPSLSARAVKNALEIRGLADASVQTVYKLMRRKGLGGRKRHVFSEAAKAAAAAMLQEDPSLSAREARDELERLGLADLSELTVYKFMCKKGLGERKRHVFSDAAKAAVVEMLRENTSLSAREARDELERRGLANVFEPAVRSFMLLKGLSGRTRHAFSDAAKAAVAAMLRENPSLSAKEARDELERRGLADVLAPTVQSFMRKKGLSGRKRHVFSDAAKADLADMLREDPACSAAAARGEPRRGGLAAQAARGFMRESGLGVQRGADSNEAVD